MQSASAGTDLDVYVYDCSGEKCRPARTDADPSGPETAAVANPAAGTWKIVVDAASVPSGTTEYDSLDVVLAPVYGAVAIADPPEEREIGAQWTAKAHSWVAGRLEAGREPYAALVVRVKGAESYPLHAGEIAVIPAGEEPARRR